MKTKFALTAFAAAVAVFSQGAFAQASSPSRAEVKAETKAAEKSGSLVPAGQGPSATPKTAAGTGSTTSRMERKETTKAAEKSGQLKPAGDAAEMKDDKADKMKGGMVNRQDRKDATKAAVKSRSTQPAGEAATPVAEPKKQ